MRKDQFFAGVIGPIIAYLGILSAIYVQRSWWRLTENAISDLGKIGLQYNWLLNVPLVITAALLIYYGIGLLSHLTTKIERIGGVIFILGIVFLALIGIFPEGMSPHYYVSWAFFITTSIGMLITGIGIGLARNKTILHLTVGIFVVGWILGIISMKTFKGVAIPEFIGAISFTLWHYIVLLKIVKSLT
ncbi:DUF998 domain-containing protein [Pyrococcus woesei]|uniref:DUF998 domain-containing protein n=1 Tax=Pyrococcus woesei TaxID=2262 RepID=UPI003D2F005A